MNRIFILLGLLSVSIVAVVLLFLAALYPIGMIGKSMHIMYVTHSQTDTNVEGYTLTDVNNWAVDGVAGTEGGNYGGALLLVLFALALGVGYIMRRMMERVQWRQV